MRFSAEITPEEAAAGFTTIETENGSLTVRTLGTGLRAVKVRGDHGGYEYAICDDRMHPIYEAAKTLAELRMRFGV